MQQKLSPENCTSILYSVSRDGKEVRLYLAGYLVGRVEAPGVMTATELLLQPLRRPLPLGSALSAVPSRSCCGKTPCCEPIQSHASGVPWDAPPSQQSRTLFTSQMNSKSSSCPWSPARRLTWTARGRC